ncbi:hypothetical protein AA0115_g2385 [Alternaria tenuissima]|uniref:Uncharacterized protein n=1 Tax=Alternaria tenuissima TaxID=119927 RepID=A0AB37WRN6_9PLEO|nr:hypothetical protein AA0115_g2385 [Alternaria tenuissima]
MHDPRTWSFISKVVATGEQANYSKATVPPVYMVYDRALINSFKRLQGSHRGTSRLARHLTNLFLYYPFNYDRHGQLREHPHIPPDELEEWKKQMSHGVPTTKQEAVTKNATTNDHTNDEATKDVSPDAAVDEIMKMLDDSDTDTDMIPYSRVMELEEELEKTKKQVSEANKRADTAEEGIEALKVDLAGCSNDLQKSRGKVDELEDKMEVLKDDMKELKDEVEELKTEREELKAKVKQSNKDVSVAKQKTAVKEQQILRILEGMRKKKQGAGSQKRKSSEDVSKAQQKRLRTEV